MGISEEEKRGSQEVFYLPRDGDVEDFEKSEEEIEFDKFREEMKDGISYAKINVYRQPVGFGGRGSTKKLTFLFEAGFDEYTYSQMASKLLSEYGTGTYRLQARDDKNILRMNRAINVEAPKEDPASGENSSGLMREFSHAMATQTEIMRDIMQPTIGPVSDPMDTMVKMMSAMGAMMGAMGIQRPEPAAPPKTMLEQLTEFQMLRELMDGNNSGNGGDGNLMGLLTATVNNLGPMLGLALKAGQENGDVNAAGIIGPQKAIENVVEAKPVNTENPAQKMEQYLKILLVQAKGNAKPEDVADFSLKQIPDDQLENVDDFLSDTKCIENCVVVIPEISEHLEWFEKWRDAMINGMAQIFDDGSDVIELGDDADLTKEKEATKTDPDSEAGSDGTEDIASEPSTETSSTT